MDIELVQKLVREHLGLRLGPEMSLYVLRRLREIGAIGSDTSIPLLAADARTGIPIRQVLPAALLAQTLSGALPAHSPPS